jgi:hypothetical protein
MAWVVVDLDLLGGVVSYTLICGYRDQVHQLSGRTKEAKEDNSIPYTPCLCIEAGWIMAISMGVDQLSVVYRVMRG